MFPLLRALMRTSKVVETTLDTQLEPSALSATKLLTLCQIAEAEEPLSLGNLAAHLAFVKSNATQLVDRLEADSLVRRVPAAHDRRCTLLEMTEDGKHRHEVGLDALQPLMERLETMYSPDERAQLLSLLGRLADGL